MAGRTKTAEDYAEGLKNGRYDRLSFFRRALGHSKLTKKEKKDLLTQAYEKFGETPKEQRSRSGGKRGGRKQSRKKNTATWRPEGDSNGAGESYAVLLAVAGVDKNNRATLIQFLAKAVESHRTLPDVLDDLTHLNNHF